MNEQIHAIANSLQKDYGLDDYVLKRHHIFSETNVDNNTNYILSLEWFPEDQVNKENEDFNPDGSVVMDVDLHTNKIRRIIFVNDVSFAQEGIFPSPNIEHVIEWIEELTGLMFGRQFKLMSETERKFTFHATIDNIDIAPTGDIEVAFNEDNQLSLFSIGGVFPTEDEVDWEPFSLTKEDIRNEVEQHITLIDIPIEKEEKWLKAWNLNQLFIRNDKSEILLPESLYNLNTLIEMNVSLEWDSANTYELTPKDIDFSTEVSYQDAMEKVTVTPISEEEVHRCIEETKKLVSSLFPKDSGKWTVTGMYPEKNYIITELKGDMFNAFRRKLKVIISRENYKTANYWDNKLFLDMYQSYKESEDATINKTDAMEKMYKHINVTPIYVKENKSNRYVLCGRVDCDIIIDGVTGEVLTIQ
ncbi:hypothetical protein [Paucisalibacillus sp. EB02]|uniref:hypothetical protein n=1 Tax=Paucisalibacillus sp. EB02 TaxID=1347087 RepID=UPI0004BA372B|nr:hypothetical protein [Paucisalibacillus sp. EB02]